MTQRLDIKPIFQLKWHHSRHFHILSHAWIWMAFYAPEPLHRHMLLASTEEH